MHRLAVVRTLALAILWLAPSSAWADSWAQFLVHPAMLALGIDDGEATLESLGIDRIVLRDVRFSDAVQADRIVVTFDALDVIEGKLKTVSIDGARVRARVDAEGNLAIDGLPLGSTDTQSSDEPMRFPLAALTLRNAEVTVDSPLAGPVSARTSLGASFGEVVEARGELALAHDAGDVELTGFTITATPGAGGAWRITIDGRLVAAGNGASASGPIRLTGAMGDAHTVEFSWAPERVQLPDGVALDAVAIEAEAVLPTSGSPSLTATLQAQQATGPDWQVTAPRIDLSGTPADLAAKITTADQEKPFNIRLQRDADSHLSMNGVVQIDWLTPLARATGFPVYGQGEATVALSLRTEGDIATNAASLQFAAADGLMSLALRGVRWGDLVAMEEVSGRIIGQAQQDQIRMRLPEGLRIVGLALSDEVRDRLPPLLAPLVEESVFVAYGGPTLGSPEIRVQRRTDGSYSLESSMAVRLGNPAFGLLTEGVFAVELPPAGDPVLTSPRLTLRLVDTQIGAMRASGELQIENLTATPDAASATLAFFGRTGGSPDPAIHFAQGDLDLRAKVQWAGQRLSAEFENGGQARLLGLSGRTIRMTGPTVVRLAKDREQYLAFDAASGELTGNLDFDRVAGAFTAREAPRGAESAKFRLDGLSIDILPHAVGIRVRDGQISTPNPPILASDITVDIAAGSGLKNRSGRLTIGRISHAVANPFMVPMRLQLDVTDRGKALAFNGRLADLKQRIAFTVTGEHYLEKGTGQARFHAPLLFLPNVLQPADLFPGARGLILDANAQITLDASASWTPRGLRQSGTLAFSFEHLQTAELTLRNAIAAIDFANMVPPVTAGPQRITIGKLDVGVPLTLGVVEFEMKSLDDIRLHLRQFDLFGGQVSAAPLQLDPVNLSFGTVLNVEGIDLGQALRFAEFGELKAEGELSGQIPIVQVNGEMLIQGARLETLRPGRIRYSAAGIGDALEKANQATDLLVQALKDFRFDKVAIGLDERDAEELRIQLHIAGESAQPLTYDGVTLDRLPIEININLEGPMRQILNDAADDTANITSYTWTEESR